MKNEQKTKSWLDNLRKNQFTGKVVIDFVHGGVVGVRNMELTQNTEWAQLN